MISLQQMKYIIALDDHKHFQMASEACFVTQPTLSMQLKKAEEDLGYPIFDRSSNALELTQFGEELLPVLRNVLIETSKIEMLRQRQKGEYREQLRIGVIPTISAYMVNDLFTEWKEKMEGMRIRIIEYKTEQLLEALRKKEVDCGILAGPVTSDNLRVVPLFTEEILAYCDCDDAHILSEELNNMKPWLLNEGNCLRNQMVRFCGLDSEESDLWDYSGGNLEILMNMVDQNGGYTLVPEFYKQLSSKGSKRFKSILSSHSGEIPAREIVCVFNNRSYKLPGIEKIIRSLQFHYGKKSNKEYTILPWK